jgi:hypothetical protein
LGDEHRGHDERERLGARERECQRDVRLAETNGIGEQRAAISLDDVVEPQDRGGLVRGEPRWEWERGVARCE